MASRTLPPMQVPTAPRKAGKRIGSAQPSEAISARQVPWYLWCGLLSTASSTFGVEWDYSWHRSIGRDSFWNPAHMMIYLGAVIAGLVTLYLTVAATTGISRKVRAQSIDVFGLRAPLGSFIASWGGLAALLSAPFDNWWHAAYGVDVELLSPPHVVLFLGLRSVDAGFLLLIAAAMNRARAAGAGNFRTLQRMLLCLSGLMLTGQMMLLTQHVLQSTLHSSLTYKGLAVGVAILFAFISQASGYRWAATWMASTYTLIRIAEILVLPLFPATPRLGPVENPVTHMMPGQFPLLLLVPAVLLDLLWQRTEGMKLWLRACLSGALFTGSIVAVEWPFANFLMTRAAENRFFGTMYFDYSASLRDRVHQFAFNQSGWPLWHGLLVSTGIAMVTSAIGLAVGRWVRTIQR